MSKNKNLYVYTLIGLAVCMGTVEVLLNLQDKVVSDSTQTIWGFVCLVLTILWAYFDADRPDFEKPYDFGLFAYVFWPIALPWYLFTTRGVEGLVVYFGFMSLWLGPWIAGLIAYTYFT